MNRFIQTRPETELPDNYHDYMNSPLLSLTDALRPVLPLIDRLESRITSAKCRYRSSLKHTLTEDESAALYLYTSDDSNHSIHYKLNQALRSSSRSTVKPWFGFLKLFYTALDKLPSEKKRVWRGIHIDLVRNLRKNDQITWRCISSCALSINRIKNALDDVSILCSIEVINGKSIGDNTSVFDRHEILLLPGTCLRVTAIVYDQSRIIGLCLNEISNDLHIPRTTNRDSIVSTNNASRIEPKQNDMESLYLGTPSSRGKFPMKTDTVTNNLLANKSNINDSRIFSATNFSNGDRYEVPYKNGQKLGYGVYFTASGHVYREYLADIRASGKGLCTWTNGDRYNGDFQNGQMSGDGTIHYANGCVYKGSWIDGEPNGKGISIWPNGNCYEGYHQKGKMTGYGTFHGVVRNQYKGDLVDGKAHGSGKRIWSNNDRYEGKFNNDKKHGIGIYNYASGAKYLGSWIDDEMDGEGMFIWPSGTHYEGAFKNGKRHGLGKLSFANGRIETGLWENDKYIGLR